MVDVESVADCFSDAALLQAFGQHFGINVAHPFFEDHHDGIGKPAAKFGTLLERKIFQVGLSFHIVEHADLLHSRCTSAVQKTRSARVMNKYIVM